MTEAEENLYAIYRSITDDERDDQDISIEIAFREVSVDTLRTARGYLSDTLEELETLIDSIDLLLAVNDEV